MRRALLAVLLLCAATVGAQDFIRYHPPAIPSSTLSASGTAVTSTLPLLIPDGSFSATPALAFASESGTGIYKYGANSIGFLTAGQFGLRIRPGRQGGLDFADLYTLSWSSSQYADGTSDVKLARDAANTLALRNSTNAQTFNIYNTYSSSTSYERGSIYWSSDRLWIDTQKGSGGWSIRSITISAAGGGAIRLGTSGGGLNFNDAGVFYPEGAGVANLGADPTNAWKNLYLLTSTQGSRSKAIVDNTATAFVRLTVADDDYEGCAFGWTAYAEDADTDARQVTKGRNNVAILNNSGTETCVFSASADDVATNATAGTLACTFDCAAGTNTVDLRATCDTSLDAAAETLTFEYRLDCESALTVTPQ